MHCYILSVLDVTKNSTINTLTILTEYVIVYTYLKLTYFSFKTLILWILLLLVILTTVMDA